MVVSFVVFASVLAFVCSVCLLVSGQSQGSYGPISTTSGHFVGYDFLTKNGNVAQFLGIPFAKPPIGTLRWKSPQNYSSTATVQANVAKPFCLQPNRDSNTNTLNPIIGAEDCLYLNVWVPTDAAANATAKNLPVLFYIFGGGFSFGAIDAYPGFDIVSASFGKVIVVAPNYRLGPMGFLAHPGLSIEKNVVNKRSSGMFGIEDQIQALRWVKDNIAAFGGDPTKVTISGHSAGSISVCMHIVSPLSAGLFSKAILHSGGCDSSNRTLYDSEAFGIQFAATLSVTAARVGYPITSAQVNALQTPLNMNNINWSLAAEQVNIMRKLPAVSLFLAGLALNTFFFFGPTAFGPCLDTYVLDDWPSFKFKSGRFNKVPILAGATQVEMAAFINAGSAFPEFRTPFSNTTFYTFANAATNGNANLINTYLNAAANNYDTALIGLTSAAFFVCPTRRVAMYSALYGQSTYLYSYRYNGAHSVAPVSIHGSEIPFMLGIPAVDSAFTGVTVASRNPYFLSTEDQAMSNMLQSHVIDFVTSGSPNLDPISLGVNVNLNFTFDQRTRFNSTSWPTYLFNPATVNLSNPVTYMNANWMVLGGVNSQVSQRVDNELNLHPDCLLWDQYMSYGLASFNASLIAAVPTPPAFNYSTLTPTTPPTVPSTPTSSYPMASTGTFYNTEWYPEYQRSNMAIQTTTTTLQHIVITLMGTFIMMKLAY